ncbi:MAG: GH3 auxin-responsive promoter family protein [Bacteroidota bacterium]|nr:GH3 auxin-responsive promoter family protein [Bacteroidota bacterium]
MSIKSFFGKLLARHISEKIRKWSMQPVETQEKVFRELIKGAENTVFGKEHKFGEIKSYEDFKRNVPVRDYEEFKPYIERIKSGEKDVLWKGRPIYFSKTSGTTSGTKYIPISKESIHNHIDCARNAILCYIAETGKADFINGKMIFLQGSPVLDKIGDIPTGRLSGIVAHHVPAYLQSNRMPSYKTNCIEDWEKKVDAIVEETVKENMTLISGIPSWVQMYFEKLKDKTGKKIKDIFPGFSLFIYGGVNYEPYRTKFENIIGKKIDSIELYPASEGFIAYQNSQKEKGLLLILDSGIFYEFIKADEFYSENPKRLSIGEVETNVNYALIMSTNAGMWAYCIGDTVRFVSKNPYKLVVTGRIKHVIEAFGEHVLAEEVEYSLLKAIEKYPAEINEFTVAPMVTTEGELPYHEWFIEFGREPEDMEGFRLEIDKALQDKNIYYKDLITGKVLQPLKIRRLYEGAFNNYMKSRGKLGGQNKLPRVSNDRSIADELLKHCKIE